jgi:tripartite ATP-independent transporter DctP family solute receptor
VENAMHRRSFLKAGLLGSAATGLGLARPNVSRASEPLVLRFAHFLKTDHPAHAAASQFAARVTERTAGAIRFEIFPDNALGSPPEQTEQIRLGGIDLGLPTQGQLHPYEPAFSTILLPFVFRNSQHAFRFLDGPCMDWLAPRAEKQGFILLRHWDYGFRNITNGVRAIHTPADMKGLKIRTPPEIPVQAAMEALGAEVTVIPFNKLYEALAGKTVEGQENPISVIYAQKFYEVQKHLALTRHIFSSCIHTVSAQTWKKLSPAQQAIFQQESLAAGDLMRRLMAEMEATHISELAAAGLQVTDPDRAPFRSKMGPAFKRIADLAGEANVKKFLDLHLLAL